ncbi:MAG TPA: lipoate--protein ligase family protein [Candidatus Binatia bacterium]|jgi:lipoate---protein ligase|nr:lipoate--protein ligase family protein [Candidatus Binatia bacterium]HET9880644.1 lipoate--protein ligase family protein [Candidatus Binatia bacterium]
MQYIELTLPDPASNLACDEALVESFEARRAPDGLLRIWEPKNHFIVLGHSNRIDSEVDVAACESERLSIFRRLSGGGTVMQGPGCLNYSLILRNGVDIPLGIAESFQVVLEHHKQCIQEMIGDCVDIAGVSDLVINGRKFSGNAQYRKRRFTLVHGTFLLNLDPAIVARCLRLPSKQPVYRQNRSHDSFMRNLHLDPNGVRKALKAAWSASDQFTEVPNAMIADLKKSRYGRPDWTHKF